MFHLFEQTLPNYGHFYYCVGLSVLACVAVKVGILWLKRRRFVALIDRIPGPPCRSYIFGNADIAFAAARLGLDFHESAFQAMHASTHFGYKPYGIVRAWAGPLPIIGLFSPEAIEPVLSSNVHISKAIFYDFIVPWLGLGLLISSGDKWKRHRKLLTPSFHFRILETFVPIINDQTQTLVRILEEKCKTNDGLIEDVGVFITACALDIICETAMGINIEAQKNPNSEYIRATLEASDVPMYRMGRILLHFDFIFNLTSAGKRFRSSVETLHSFTEKVIRDRKKEVLKLIEDENKNTDESDYLGRKQKMAFLDTLLHQHIKDPNSLSEQDIREEVDTFMFEGHDTTSAALSWAVHLIGWHPEVQEKIHQEMDDIFGDDKERAITLDDLRKMKYLECVAKEALRLHPSVPVVARTIAEDVDILGFLVPKGATVIVGLNSVHRDPKHWPNPEKFDPNRFLPENCMKRHPFAYVPFSGGPRNCVGQKFALLEEKALLTSIFRRFKVTSVNQRDKMSHKMGLVYKSNSPFTIRLELR